MNSSAQYDFQFQQIQQENVEIQKKQVELLRKLTLPVHKPPIFEGDILDYPKWESAFNALIEEEAIKPSHKLYYLGEYTSGSAAKMISGLLGLRTEDAYRRARKVLKERFGEPFKIYEAYRERLKTWPICVTSTDLQEYSDFLVMTQETMKTVKYLNEFSTFSAVRELAARLPTFYSNKWRESAKRIEMKNGEYTFSDFVDFSQDAARDANHPVFSYEALSATRKELEGQDNRGTKQGISRPDRKRYRGTALRTAATGNYDAHVDNTSSKEASCLLCNESHYLERCKTFLSKSVKDRVEFCKSKGICFSCLTRGHMLRHCKNKRQCETCKRAHARCCTTQPVLMRQSPVQKNPRGRQITV